MLLHFNIIISDKKKNKKKEITLQAHSLRFFSEQTMPNNVVRVCSKGFRCLRAELWIRTSSMQRNFSRRRSSGSPLSSSLGPLLSRYSLSLSLSLSLSHKQTHDTRMRKSVRFCWWFCWPQLFSINSELIRSLFLSSSNRCDFCRGTWCGYRSRTPSGRNSAKTMTKWIQREN